MTSLTNNASDPQTRSEIGRSQSPHALSVIDAIGHTPLVELKRFAAGREGRIFAKLEYLNPGHSKKDRVARKVLLDAVTRGDLRPGQTVIELTSGNTGAGAALVCAVLGHPFVAVMSRGNSEERVYMMRAFGAEVVLVDQAPDGREGQVTGEDLRRVEERTREETEARSAFRLDQFNRADNALAYEDLAAEVMPYLGNELTAFCDTVGSGGTFAGLSKAFATSAPKLRGYIVEPTAAAVLGSEEALPGGHNLQGAGYGIRHLPLLELIEYSGRLAISDSEARDAARMLAAREGIFGGYTSGSNAAAALRLLDGPERGGSILILICDSGLKYLSTDLWAL